MKIDVVITSYNSWETLQRTLQSLYNQTRLPDNIIIVDDCSSDYTYTYLVTHKARKENPVNIEAYCLPTNMGPGIAKRTGIQLSEADAITFVDSDDTLEPTAIEIMEETMMEYDADIVCPTITKIYEDGKKKVIPQRFEVVNGPSCFLKFIKFDWCNIFANSKLIKKHILEDLPYSEFRFEEDTDSVYKWFWKAKKTVRMDIPLYNYYQVSTSLIHSPVTVSKIWCSLEAQYHIYDFLKDHDLPPYIASYMPSKLMQIQHDVDNINESMLSKWEKWELAAIKKKLSRLKKLIGFIH